MITLMCTLRGSGGLHPEDVCKLACMHAHTPFLLFMYYIAVYVRILYKNKVHNKQQGHERVCDMMIHITRVAKTGVMFKSVAIDQLDG